MLNYILPPIVIIASLSYLIIFLFRKVEQLPQQDLLDEQEGARKAKPVAAISSAIGQFGLKVLERMMHKTKLLSLKFHNTSNDLFQTLREKRQRKMRIQQEMIEKNEQEVLETVQSAAAEKPQAAPQALREPRPMIGQKVTHPEKVLIEKNKLEDALIKRIAVNPRDIEAYERLGDYYLESKSYQDSLECFRQVLKLSPSHQKARLRIRRLQRISK